VPKIGYATLVFLVISLANTVFVSAAAACSSEKTSVEQDLLIRRSISRISVLELKKTIRGLTQLSERYTWESQSEAANFLQKRLQSFGIEPELDVYEFRDKKWKNVIVTFPGEARDLEIVMAIAHLDSISDKPGLPAPGADDNASGTASIIEIARVLRGLKTKRTIKLAIFSNEEQKRAGSSDYARRVKQQSINLKAVINVDEIGCNDPFRSLGETPDGILGVAKYQLGKIKRHYYKRFYPEGLIEIGGRTADRSLADFASRVFKEYSTPGMKLIIDDSCG